MVGALKPQRRSLWEDQKWKRSTKRRSKHVMRSVTAEIVPIRTQRLPVSLIPKQIPIVQIDLHAGNVTIAQECHKALIQLRNKRNFSDLQRFFEAYGSTPDIS